MPRASWRGHLRLSLVSCPIYLSPATARMKPIRLHQVWEATPAGEADEPPSQHTEREVTGLRASRPHSDQVEDAAEPLGPVSRITLRPHDPTTGEEIEKDEVVRGYEYERGQYVTFTPDELKALDLESSKVIDLEMFIPTTARAGHARTKRGGGSSEAPTPALCRLSGSPTVGDSKIASRDVPRPDRAAS